MYAGTRPRHRATALVNEARSSRNTEMPIKASVMMSSQLPLAPEPLLSTGRYTVRSRVANRPGVRPATRVRPLDQLGRPRPARPGPAGLQRRVAVGVRLEGRRPGVEELDRLGGVPAVPGHVPDQRVGVRGQRVRTLVRAAVVRVGVRAALHRGARPGGPGKGGVLAPAQLVEGG